MEDREYNGMTIPKGDKVPPSLCLPPLVLSGHAASLTPY